MAASPADDRVPGILARKRSGGRGAWSCNAGPRAHHGRRSGVTWRLDGACAAQILAYAPDKGEVLADLVHAMRDPSGDVRNNAMRALAVMAGAEPALRIPPGGFIERLHSLAWTDRNKAAVALAAISERRDPRLLARLRRQATGPLVDMARWRSAGHAMPALLILGRIGGWSDDAVRTAWTRGEREAVIHAALER